MSEIICEEIARRAGFIVSVGNWICPDGLLITGESYETHHWETIKAHLGYDPKTDNHLKWMNDLVETGYIRLVFRSDVFFQVGGVSKEDIWSSKKEFVTMRSILQRIPEIEIHIFSRKYYVIGIASDILSKNDNLQIQEVK